LNLITPRLSGSSTPVEGFKLFDLPKRRWRASRFTAWSRGDITMGANKASRPKLTSQTAFLASLR